MHLFQPVNYSPVKGFSLIEFMIAIAISLVVMLAVSIAWQSGYKTQQAQSNVSRLNETIGFAMNLLSREIKQSGLINTTNAKPPEQIFCSTDPTIGSSIVGKNDPATIDPTTTGLSLAGATVAIANKSDAIRVRYYGEYATGTSATADCLGNIIPNGQLVEDTLYVAPDPKNNNEPSLWCHTSNTNTTPLLATQPMVAGVESLQMLYGEDTDGDGIINRYVPWQLVTNADNILSVKVSIIARSAGALSVGVPAGKIYYHFGLGYSDPTGGTPGTLFTDPGDKLLRLPQPMSTEIATRNFIHC